MKRRWTVAATAVVMLLAAWLVSGCAGGGKVERENAIPDDGIVPSQVFETLKQTGDLAMFSGEDNAVCYQWTFIGTDIETPEEADLRVRFDSAQDAALLRELGGVRQLGFRYESPQPKPGKPVLGIVLGEEWKECAVSLYAAGEGASPRFLREIANVDGVASFVPEEWDGAFLLIGTDKSAATPSPEPAASQPPEPAATETPAATQPPARAEAPQEPAPAATPAPEPAEPAAAAATEAPAATQPPVQPSVSTVSLSIRCDMALKNYDKLAPSVRDDRIVPPDGQILNVTGIEISEGESVFDVLQRICKDNKIHLESTYTPVRKSAYIEGINNLYEFDCGPLSGWMYSVNGWYPNYGASLCTLGDGDRIVWNYTCDLGRDLGQYGVVQQSRD